MKTFHNPVRVIQTSNWFQEYRNISTEFAVRNPLVITSKGNLQRLELVSLFQPDSIFSDVTSNPTFSCVQKAIDFSKGCPCHGVVAIGGGSVMDVAKVVMAAKGANVYKVSDIISTRKRFIRRLKAIFIPTTHGTGSEVTMWGTLWNTDEKKKYSISSPELYPDVAILDGSLTLTLPLDDSIITVLDALSHGFEAIWNKNKNPQSTKYALESIYSIFNNVNNLKNNPYDLSTRTNLLIASNISGLAFSNTGTAAAHSIGYPLTAHFGIPHGLASSLALKPLLEINGPIIKEELKLILASLGLHSINGLINSLAEIPHSIVKTRLSDWGVKHNDLEWLASECMSSDRIGNNIKDLTDVDIRAILEQMF